ncbi:MULTISPECIES: homocysteine S-methyltransferase family protein [unclassified Thomasclavelia]|uniref:homocysteine S-methyltransferase family protein n=1 Tax=unclassified Thomasclavelia TaxID=3025756 RepID=UPI000B383F8E|nr:MULTISPECIES: homocysteine S-methyltransferase family protein [unclassified Thomasclavelia]OUP78403.1 homocysteine methyltransferase [Erysipelatoclostridium sp. An173]OUQ07180.1 homocysteine methyltransferase [Erysipelatoclostridium sp. An15]
MLQERLKKEILVFDGAMGTQLQEAGLKAGEIPECLNITHPELIQSIHQKYLNAGADFITTNTFGANALKMKDVNYSLKEIIEAAIDNAKAAQKNTNRQNNSYIALDIGPIGQLLEPMGTLSFDQAYEIIKEQVLLAKDKVDLVLLETMTDIYEVKAGVLAVKENSDLPVFVTMTYETNQRTLSGCDPVTMVNILEGLNVDALGINCSLGPVELTPIINEVLKTASLPVILQPNAGLPCLVAGKTCYNMDSDTFVAESIKHVKNGVRIIGGCCGTTPEFIAKLKKAIPAKPVITTPVKATRVSSGSKTVEFGHHVVVCGERLNPTGKKKLKEALKQQRYDELVIEAIKQDQAKAHVLDVNVGLPGIDEVATMKHVIKLLQEVISLPLQIDSSNAQAIEQACRYYNGKPLINSVNGKTETMEAIFPIVKKYGGVVIGLTLDENGIPPKAKDRLEIAKKIIKTAAKYGISKENIIIDCLVLTVSAQQKEVMETIKAVRMVKEELGVHTVLGVSNVSFGLPNRPLLNKTFLTMAMAAGLDLPIINPLDKELMDAIDAFNVLYNYDQDATIYIQNQSNQTVTSIKNTTDFTLEDIIIRGLKDEVKTATKKQLETKDGLEIINNILIPALDKVGKQYENNTIFLPQLIQAAETSKIAFGVIKDTFKETTATKGPVIMATVHGDIHDIGKNIVKVVLESYGYKIIDLGKDVPPETVVDAFYQYHPKAIGLSALMTTTVASMEKTIAMLKKIDNMCPIFVGGAVLTADYAKEINADYYSKDAMDAVELLNRIID